MTKSKILIFLSIKIIYVKLENTHSSTNSGSPARAAGYGRALDDWTLHCARNQAGELSDCLQRAMRPPRPRNRTHTQAQYNPRPTRHRQSQECSPLHRPPGGRRA